METFNENLDFQWTCFIGNGRPGYPCPEHLEISGKAPMDFSGLRMGLRVD